MIRPYRDSEPQIAATAFVEKSASVIGDVSIGEQSSVWFQVVIRADVNAVRIGERTNVQDGTVIHVTHKTHPTLIGNDVTIGHNATLHGCRVGNACLIGIGAIVLDGAEIGDCSLIAAGTVVAPGTLVPPRSLVMGCPGRVKRSLTDDECRELYKSAQNYIEYARNYL